MARGGLLIVCWLAVASATGAAEASAPEASTDLRKLAASLDLTGQGVARWLARLGVTRDGPPVERLLAVSLTGELLMERHGEGSQVRVDPELDDLLRRAGTSTVLVHNHPASVGLSLADLRHLGKPGLAAIVAIGHDGSVFIASAGPRLDPLLFAERQHAVATAEVRKQLRIEWPSGRLTVAAGDAHTSHLVTLALAKAGVVQYWFTLRGNSRVSYEYGRLIFSRIAIVSADRLKRTD